MEGNGTFDRVGIGGRFIANPTQPNPTQPPTLTRLGVVSFVDGSLARWLAGSLARWLAGSLARWLAGWLAG